MGLSFFLWLAKYELFDAGLDKMDAGTVAAFIITPIISVTSVTLGILTASFVRRK